MVLVLLFIRRPVKKLLASPHNIFIKWLMDRGPGMIISPDYGGAITGFPTIQLQMPSTTGDGAVFVYLEDVSPDGRVTYLNEGMY